MIKVINLVKRFKDASGEIEPVSNMNFELLDGRFVSIVGRSGSGKSTLLKIIGGLLKPNEGEVLVDGINIYNMSEKEMSKFRCEHIGFIFQDFFLEEKFTVYQNLEIVLMISNVKVSERKSLIESALDTVGLLNKKDSLVQVLSGGEKQRVCIARAIINEPRIILADEPCGNLDIENGKIIMKLLRNQVDKGKLVILVTHNIEDAGLTDEIITLQDGRIINYEAK